VSRKLWWIAGGAAVVILAVAGAGAWYLFGDDAPPAPEVAADCGSTGGPATADGAWQVAPGEGVFVGYRMTETFRGDIVHKTAVGRTPAVEGAMTIAGGTVTAASVTADLRELSSDRSPRDNYIRTNGIETDTFPEARFELTSPITLPAAEKGRRVHVDAAGSLTLHGVTRPVTVPLDACWSGAQIEVAGTAPVVLADYDIEPPETSVVKTDDHGSFELALTFTPRASAA
jgi:polyisoprenoid-binding protein YceI